MSTEEIGGGSAAAGVALPRTSRPLARKKRRGADVAFHAGLLASLTLAMGALAWLLTSIVVAGVGNLDWAFLTDNISTNAELAGFNDALRGTLVLMMITLIISVPLGVASALYLEKMAVSDLDLRRAPRRRRLSALERRQAAGEESALLRLRIAATRLRLKTANAEIRGIKLIDVSISNLAAVPSIIYGLLGLAVFVAFVGINKSLLAGGLTLALLVLPVIVIAAREALRAVPVSIEQAAMALGATRWQAVRKQVLPAAVPGILTGTILAMSRAIGESAPLIVVGGAIFGTASPSVNPLESGDSTLFAMPVLIFSWAQDARPEFQALAASGIIVLLGTLILMNLVAIVLRNKFSRRW